MSESMNGSIEYGTPGMEAFRKKDFSDESKMTDEEIDVLVETADNEENENYRSWEIFELSIVAPEQMSEGQKGAEVVNKHWENMTESLKVDEIETTEEGRDVERYAWHAMCCKQSSPDKFKEDSLDEQVAKNWDVMAKRLEELNVSEKNKGDRTEFLMLSIAMRVLNKDAFDVLGAQTKIQDCLAPMTEHVDDAASEVPGEKVWDYYALKLMAFRLVLDMRVPVMTEKVEAKFNEYRKNKNDLDLPWQAAFMRILEADEVNITEKGIEVK